MNISGLSKSFKKKIWILFHLLFLFISLTGATLSYLNDNFGTGLSGLSATSYEDSLYCADKLDQDVEDIFQYIFFQSVFETDGVLDYTKPIISVQAGPGEDVTYTVDAMIRYAKNRGYYLNESFQVIGGSANKAHDLSDVYINWRTYRPNIQYKEPGERYSNMEELAVEVLSLLGTYYTAKSKFLENPTNLYFTICYQIDAYDSQIISNANTMELDQLKQLGKYIYLTGDSVIPETNMDYAPVKVASLLEAHNIYQTSDYYMILALDTSYKNLDSYAIDSNQFDKEHGRYVLGLILFLIGIIGMVCSLFFMVNSIKSITKISKESYALTPPRLTIEGTLVSIGFLVLIFYYLSNIIGNKAIYLLVPEIYWYYARLLMNVIIFYLGIITAIIIFIQNFYANTLESNSRLCRVYKDIKHYIKNSSFTSQTILSYSSYLILNILTIVLIFYCWFNRDTKIYYFLFVACCIILLLEHIFMFYQTLKDSYSKKRIEEAIHHISSGNTSYQIDLTGFSIKESMLAKQINEIGIGLEAAIQEKVKSERLKADLITNVSHDIKTPLTSIINYVDLLKREHIQNERIQNYLDVLEQKSQRLKTLTEDLVEASKASSGNLKLEMSNINFVSLVQQTNGEFEEKFGLRKLTIVTTFPEANIYIEADGRRLWRVLENLYNNALKYAMPNSRVYVDIETDDKNVTFTIKNVSENPLNIHVDELTERFVRGDVSRTTEGSGLGLSIAKSLTQLQHGDFEIIIDGDLFKAALKFPIVIAE